MNAATNLPPQPLDAARIAATPWEWRFTDFGCPAACHHGTSDCYRHHGCRCPDARADANRERATLKRRRLRQQGQDGNLFVDSLAVHRQIRALRAAGWRFKDQARELGCADSAIAHLMRHPTVRLSTQRRYAALFARLRRRPGPDLDEMGRPGPSTVTARKADPGFDSPISTWTPRGWAPPWAWNRIDLTNPDATPWHYDWGSDDVQTVDRVMKRTRGLWTPPLTLTAGQAAAAIGHILLTVPESAAALHRVFDRAHRHCTRVVTAGGVRTTAAREWAEALRDQPLPLNDRDTKEAA